MTRIGETLDAARIAALEVEVSILRAALERIAWRCSDARLAQDPPGDRWARAVGAVAGIAGAVTGRSEAA